MVNIVLILSIIFIIYLLFGFICYGMILGEMKYIDNKRLLKLGLSRDALEFKPDSKNIEYKLMLLIICTTCCGSIFIYCCYSYGIPNNTFISMLKQKRKYGFKIW